MIKESTRLQLQAEGYDFIQEDYVGNIIAINTNNWNDDKAKLLQEKYNLVLWKEGTGNKNWVLYDPDEFEEYENKSVFYFYHLHYKGKTGIVNLPINASSCFHMFSECTLPEGFTLGDKFDTSSVIDMSLMFRDCTLPKGFTLGDKFDTSSVTDMGSMFFHCILPKGFTLGDKFDTSSVTNMHKMFDDCTLPQRLLDRGITNKSDSEIIINALKSNNSNNSTSKMRIF